MASLSQPATATEQTARTFGNGYFFGVPVGDLGWFASLLIGLALGFVAFFLATFAAIVGFLFYNSGGRHADFSLTYKYFGLPVGIVVMMIALSYLAMLWVKRVTRR